MDPFPSAPRSSGRDRLVQIGALLGLLLLIASGWIAYFLVSGQKTDVQNQLTAARAEYAQKEKLARLTDEELVVAQAEAYNTTKAKLKPEQTPSNFRVQKLAGDFATVFSDLPSGGAPATYLKRVKGVWTVFRVSSEPLDSDQKAAYGMPANY